MEKLIAFFTCHVGRVIYFSLFTFHFATAQNIGIGTNSPNASAQLDVTSTNKGFLPPRMTYAQRNSIQNPVAGLMVYCTDCGSVGELQIYDGIAWTNLIGEATKSALPSLNTANVSSIAQTTAISGGNITSDGGAAVTARGVVWSTSVSPTVALTTKTTNGSGMGIYTSNLTGLNSNTTYYVRAYATNSVGTAYGDEVNFKTTGTPPPSSVTDIDGNVYPTVTINNQVWMAENLRTTKYRDGTLIPNITDDAQWKNRISGAWCHYNNDSNNDIPYGKLYNWFAVRPGAALCPTGWHMPTDAEWTTLSTFLGGSSVAGGKMKSTGSDYWETPNTGADNTSGFSAFPGGVRDVNGTFASIRKFGYWWSTTEFDLNTAWFRLLFFNNTNIFRSNSMGKTSGLSVRCVKD